MAGLDATVRSWDRFYVTALYTKHKARVGPWSSGQHIYNCSPHISSCCFLCMLQSKHAKHRVRIVWRFPFLFPVVGSYAWLCTEMLDRSFLMISLTERKEREVSISGACLGCRVGRARRAEARTVHVSLWAAPWFRLLPRPSLRFLFLNFNGPTTSFCGNNVLQQLWDILKDLNDFFSCFWEKI